MKERLGFRTLNRLYRAFCTCPRKATSINRGEEEMLQPMQPMATNASFRSIASWLSDNIASMQEKMMAMCHQGLDREFLEPILVRRSTPPQRLNCNPTSNRHAYTIPCIPIFKHVPTCHIYDSFRCHRFVQLTDSNILPVSQALRSHPYLQHFSNVMPWPPYLLALWLLPTVFRCQESLKTVCHLLHIPIEKTFCNSRAKPRWVRLSYFVHH
jgi:hypothetical protein